MIALAWSFVTLMFLMWNIWLSVTQQRTVYDDFTGESVFECMILIMLFLLLPLAHILLIAWVAGYKWIRKNMTGRLEQ